uniref:E3 ubiquitin-protein ligase RBBP6 n=2 Tax=Anthurium amnicola TaxID=1678845 RepID=A0A1D1Z3E3_9ARAE
MPVRFKFRSSVGFDSVDLGGRPSISVRDLRARIVQQKNLQICADFRLVISDSGTGEAYESEDCSIPEGSSVIIKRVPAAPERGDAAGIGHETGQAGFYDTLVSSPSENAAMDNFDDFGNDLYPALDAPLQDSDSDERSIYSIMRRKQDDGPRCSESPISRCQNFERSNLSEALSKENIGQNYDIVCEVEDNAKQSNLHHKAEELRELDETVAESSPAMENIDLPTELQCFLCNKIFQEAVMIPCCQHSFCDKCIRVALVDKGCCPKCSSTKCRVEDLLPNLSLRHAIEHFLETQIPIVGSEKVTPRYAPDGESGIQAKEASCALSIRQLEQILPLSPSVTGKGSNQVVAESACESLPGIKQVPPGTGSNIINLDANKPAKPIILLHKNRKLNERDDPPKDAKHVACYEGGSNFTKLPQTLARKEEAMLTTKKNKGLIATTPDASGILPPSRLRKGDRNCFMCGSPDHLIRDCPAALNPYPCLQTGNAAFHGGMPAYGAAYWHSNSFPYVRPYANIYGAPGMLPFDPAIKSVPPFGIPYMSPFYAGPQVSWMGSMGPSMISGAARPLRYPETMELQDGDQRCKSMKERLERDETFDVGDDFTEDHRYPDSRRRSSDHKFLLDKDISRSYSDVESPRLHRKHSHDGHFHGSSHQRPTCTSDDEVHSGGRKHERVSNLAVSARERTHYSEKSHSDLHDVSDSSDYHTREKSRHRHRSSSKKQSEKRGQCGSDSNHKSHHRNWRETSDDGEKVVCDHKKHCRKHHNHSEVTLAPDSSGDHRPSSKEFSHSSRHSKDKEKSSNDQLEGDRWELVDGLNEVYGSGYHYRKHRRTH